VVFAPAGLAAEADGDDLHAAVACGLRCILRVRVLIVTIDDPISYVERTTSRRSGSRLMVTSTRRRAADSASRSEGRRPREGRAHADAERKVEASGDSSLKERASRA
jgi:hypothetical protein